jgi:hypothetical protein
MVEIRSRTGRASGQTEKTETGPSAAGNPLAGGQTVDRRTETARRLLLDQRPMHLPKIAVIGRADDFRQQGRRHLHGVSPHITKVTFVLALGTDDSKAIRWLIVLMGLCCDAGDCADNRDPPPRTALQRASLASASRFYWRSRAIDMIAGRSWRSSPASIPRRPSCSRWRLQKKGKKWKRR